MSIESLVKKAKKADNAYYNIGKPIMSDAEYDKLRATIKKLNPKHSYLKTLRTKIVSRDKVKLPIPLGGLRKTRPLDIEDFVKKNGDSEFSVTPKLDGLTGCLVFKDGNFKKAYTGGDGYVGRNVTRSAQNIIGVNKKFYIKGNVYIKGEFCIHKSVFDRKFKGEKYKNPRNFCVGCLNKALNEEAYKGLRNMVFVAYSFEQEGKSFSKYEQLSLLESLGFIVIQRPYRPLTKKQSDYLDKAFTFEAKTGESAKQKEYKKMFPASFGQIIPYAWKKADINTESITNFLFWCKDIVDIDCDGLVIEANNIKYRTTEDELLPDFAAAIKLDPEQQDSKIGVIDYTNWNLTNKDVLKPTPHLKKPLVFNGVEVSNVFAHSAKNFKELSLHDGCKIKVIRSGDVIPYIIDSKPSSKPQLPKVCPNCKGKLEWTDTYTDLYCVNHCYSKSYGRVFKFFSVVNADGLKGRSIEQLIQNGFSTVKKILKASPKDFAKVLGKNRGKTLHKNLHETLKFITMEQVMHGSNHFQNEKTSLGTLRLKSFIDAIGKENISKEGLKKILSPKGYKILSKVENAGGVTVDMFIDNIENFVTWYDKIKKYVPIKSTKKIKSGKFKDRVFAFTGFRDSSAERYIIENGGSIGGVTKNTFVLFSAGSSTKTTKAKQYGVKVVSKDKVWSFLKKE